MIEKMKNRIELVTSSRHPIRLLIAYFLRKTGLSRIFFIQKDHYKLRFYPTALLMHLWADRGSRVDEELLLARLVKCGSTVVDIGANVGTLAIPLASYVGNYGRVIAIEAHPKIFHYLRENVKLNSFDNVITVNKAVGEAKGKLHFSDLSSDDQNSVVQEGGLEVEVDTLENILAPWQIEKIRLLKIDVEGFELFVLRGAKSVLDRVEIVYFESWEEHFSKYGYKTVDVIKFLEASGFEVYRFTNECWVEPVHENYISHQCENLLAVKDRAVLHEIYEKN